MYYAEVMWWYEYGEEYENTHIFIAADSYEEATRYIIQAFDHIESFKIEKFKSEERHIIYIPKEVVQQVKEENLY